MWQKQFDLPVYGKERGEELCVVSESADVQKSFSNYKIQH